MTAKNGIQVLIGGKIYKLSGYESEEYLQKIALYINNKMQELERTTDYKRNNPDDLGTDDHNVMDNAGANLRCHTGSSSRNLLPY